MPRRTNWEWCLAMAWYAGMISNLSRFIGFHSLIAPFYQCTRVPKRINVWRCIRLPLIGYWSCTITCFSFLLAFFFFCFRKSLVAFEFARTIGELFPLLRVRPAVQLTAAITNSFTFCPSVSFSYLLLDRTRTQCVPITTFHGKLLPATWITTISTPIGMLVRVDFDAKVQWSRLGYYTEFGTA